MVFRMDARVPMVIGMGTIVAAAVLALIIGISRGALPVGGIVAIVAIILAAVGLAALVWFKSATAKRLPNRVPGFGLCFSGKARTVDEHSRLLSEFVIAWRLYVEPDTTKILATIAALDVEWRAGESFKDGLRELYGVTRSPNLVIVAVREGRTIGATALAHEIVHAHLWNDGDPDYDHVSGKGPWTAAHDRVIAECRSI